MAVLTDYDKWRKHYLSMIDGKVPPNQDISVVSTNTSQVGKGLELISPAQDSDNRAKAIVKKAIKKTPTRKRAHSTTTRGRKRTNKKATNNKRTTKRKR